MSNASDSTSEHNRQEWQSEEQVGIVGPYRVLEMVNKIQYSLWKDRWAANKGTVQLYDQNKSKIHDFEVKKKCFNKHL